MASNALARAFNATRSSGDVAAGTRAQAAKGITNDSPDLHYADAQRFLGMPLAWLGLVPKQNSSGGKERMGGISKMGDRYVRQLLVVGATAVIRFARNKPTALTNWVNRLLDKKQFEAVLRGSLRRSAAAPPGSSRWPGCCPCW